ncbi:MAG TPA: hypothetical protein VN666_21930 [Nitrospira sp.]|nr:hypothetical protein [Nitrospira sp.]
MGVGDILKDVGTGVARAGKAAVPVLERVAQVESGQAPQIDAEQRKQKEKLEDEEINAKAKILDDQLATGIKYGTLTNDQQQQYAQAISDLYSHPRHAPTLMEKLRKAIHPNGAFAQGPQAPMSSLPNPVPEGGTLQADTDAAVQRQSGKAPYKEYTSPDGKSRQWFQVGEEPEGWNAVSGTSTARPVPYFSGAVGKQNAVAMQAAGKVFKDANGNQINASQIPDGMFLLPIFAGNGQEYFELGTDKGRYQTAGNQRLYEPSVGSPNPQAPSIGPARVGNVSVDQYGNRTTTTPQTLPAPQSQPNAAPRTGVAAILPKRPTTGAKPVQPSQVGGTPLAPPKLDAEGHVPDAPGINPQVREFANQLLDGKDIKDIPQRAKAPAADLARKYGWEQGAFTPKEKLLINEATAKLVQLQNSPSLKVLDSTLSREKIAPILAASQEKPGLLTSLAAPIAAGTLNKDEQEFVRLYNAAVGVVAGLAPITRGNRPTEAGIRRLMIEFPNVLQSASADDAKKRLDQLLQEVRVAEQFRGNTPIGESGVGGALGGSVQIDRDASGRIIGVH